MSPLSPAAALSPADSLNNGAKVCSASKGPERPTWSEKTQDSEPPSLTPQAPVRSALASINIVVACTSSLMITSALGSAVTISLPYMGKDLNIRKGDLQWILSAYSISSVSILCTVIMPHRALAYRSQACFLLLCGRLADLYGRKFVWLIGYLITGIFCLSASFARCMSDSTLHYFLPSSNLATPSWDNTGYHARDTRDRRCCHDPGLCRSPLGDRSASSERTITRQLGILSRAFPLGPSRSIAFATFSAGAPIGSAFSTVLSSILTQLTR